MQIDDIIVEKHIVDLQPEAFAIYSFITLRCNQSGKKYTRILTGDISGNTGICRVTVKKHRLRLEEKKYISIKKKLVKNKYIIFYKLLKTPKLNLVLYNNKNTSKNTNISKGTRKRYIKTYNNIMKKVLSHPRYDNDYYKDRKFRFGKKESAHVGKLIKRVPDINNYIDWWLEKKAYKMSGLNIGLICCIPMIEQYEIENGVLKKPKRESEVKKNLDRISKIRKENIKFICEEIEEAEKKGEDPNLSPEDKRILRKAVRDNLVIKVKDGYRLNF